jgi:hypothetical protein
MHDDVHSVVCMRCIACMGHCFWKLISYRLGTFRYMIGGMLHRQPVFATRMESICLWFMLPYRLSSVLRAAYTRTYTRGTFKKPAFWSIFRPPPTAVRINHEGPLSPPDGTSWSWSSLSLVPLETVGWRLWAKLKHSFGCDIGHFPCCKAIEIAVIVKTSKFCYA